MSLHLCPTRIRRRSCLIALLAGPSAAVVAADVPLREAMRRAEALRDDAVRVGDQPFGAVVLRGEAVVGAAPSRVVTANDPTAHAEMEAEMSEMSDEDRQMFLEELGQTEPGLNRLIRSAYKLLGLQTYFTAGVKEVRAWTIHVGDTGPQAAGVIHTDFEKGYIRAQTIAFDDYIAFKGEQGAKDAGKMRAEGKDYVVKDGDVLNFLFSS